MEVQPDRVCWDWSLSPRHGRGPRGFAARLPNPTAVANSETKRNLRYLLKRTLCSFSYPHFYISKLRVSVCICETSQTFQPQPRGRARSLQPWSHITKKKTLSENGSIPVTYSSNDLFIILFVLWATESIKSEKCCTVYILNCISDHT